MASKVERNTKTPDEAGTSLVCRDTGGTPGFVYFVRAGRTNTLKIGWARSDVEKRLRELQTGCPHTLHLIGFMPGSQAEERDWHYRFCHLRTRGEWFRLDGDLRSAINRLAVDRPDYTSYLHLSVMTRYAA